MAEKKKEEGRRGNSVCRFFLPSFPPFHRSHAQLARLRVPIHAFVLSPPCARTSSPQAASTVPARVIWLFNCLARGRKDGRTAFYELTRNETIAPKEGKEGERANYLGKRRSVLRFQFPPPPYLPFPFFPRRGQDAVCLARAELPLCPCRVCLSPSSHPTRTEQIQRGEGKANLIYIKIKTDLHSHSC